MYLYKIITEFIIAVCHYAFPYKIRIKRVNNTLTFCCGEIGKSCVLQNV